MKALFAIALIALSSSFAQAKGSSYVDDSGTTSGGFVPIALADRVSYYEAPRLWQTKDGGILICPYDATTKPEKVCSGSGMTARNTVVLNAWVPVEQVTPPGFEVTGYSFSFNKYNERAITIFYRRIK